MSIPVAYSNFNLNNDDLSLANAVRIALTETDFEDIKQAWIDTASNAAKITSGLSDLAAEDPKRAGLLGNLATVIAVQESSRHILATLQTTNDINAIKASGILSVVGGISEVTGNFLVKPGPLLVTGLTLKCAGLLAGVAQNIVEDQTIGQLMGVSAANNNAPVVPRGLFEYAPDGVTLLNTMISTEVGNHQVQVYWARNANGQFSKNESISSIRSDGTLKCTIFAQREYGYLKRLAGSAWKGTFTCFSANDVNWQKSA
ncbi:MAG: hypothetical protein JWQ41_2699 [Variovorax sp.]|nr:hypothetical protein [Variovorax sp.]